MNEFSKRANAFINLAESFAAELNDKLAEDKDDTMNARDIFNQGYDDGYRDGFFKGYEEAKNEAEQRMHNTLEELKAAKAEIKGLHTAIASIAKHVGNTRF